MHLFEVIANDVTNVPPLPVFADSYDLAAQYYAVWWLHHRDGEMPAIEVWKRNPLWPGLDVAMLDEALKLERPGIGCFDPNRGWRIDHPDDDDAGKAR